MAEPVDADDSKSSGRKALGVRLPSLAPPLSAAKTLTFSEAEQADNRRVNRRLATFPRFRLRGRWERDLVHTLLLARNFTGDRVLRKCGLRPRALRLEALGRTVKVRVLRPKGPCRGVYLDIHGGGWAVGNARMDDPYNAERVLSCGIATVSVEYRLLPRHTIADAMADCEIAASALAAHAPRLFGTDRLFIGGESAGAHLAVTTLLRLKQRPEELAKCAGAVLLYGLYDFSGTPSVRGAKADSLVLHGPSIIEGLTRATGGLSESRRRDPGLSPLYADLSGLPPALLVAGSIDPLLDDSTLLAERWEAANGNAELVVVPEGAHAFNRFGGALAAKTNAYVCAWINERL